MIIYTEKEICERFNTTPELMDAATRILNATTGEIFYQNTSLTTGETYEVHHRYYPELNRYFYTCTCKSGQCGFYNAKAGSCKHVRASIAQAYLYRQDQRLLMAKEADLQREARLETARKEQEAKLQAQKEAAIASVKALRNPAGIRQSTPFSLLK